MFSSGVESIKRNCGQAVRQRDMLSSLKLHNPIRALLVKYSVAALSATDHVSLLQSVFSPTVAANVRHAWVAVRASVHDIRTQGIKGSVPVTATCSLEIRAANLSRIWQSVIQTLYVCLLG